MASFLQYRRLRREAQEDLSYAQEAKRIDGSALSASTLVSKEEELEESRSKEEEQRYAEFKNLIVVPGVTVSRPEESDGSVIFEVGWKEDDPSNPLSWTLGKKWFVMLTCCAIAIPLTMLASIEGPVQEAFDAHFGVNAEAGSMTTGEASLLIF